MTEIDYTSIKRMTNNLSNKREIMIFTVPL